jgi:hypothetical protein
VRLGVNLPGPFWISSRIGGCGCLTILLWPIEVALWLLVLTVLLYIALARYLWPKGWWGKAITVIIPVVVIIIAAATSPSQPTSKVSAPSAQTTQPAQAFAQSPSPTPAPSHTTHRWATWGAFISRYSSDAVSFHVRDARAYCTATHPADIGCVQRLRKHARQLGIIPVQPSPVASTSSASSSGSGGGSCHPTTSSGNCYEPGELCSIAEHGETGVAGDGETIKCEDNNGWRWEPV